MGTATDEGLDFACAFNASVWPGPSRLRAAASAARFWAEHLHRYALNWGSRSETPLSRGLIATIFGFCFETEPVAATDAVDVLSRTTVEPVLSVHVEAVWSKRLFDRDRQDRHLTNPAWFWPTLLGMVAFGIAVRIAFAISIMSRGLTADAKFFHTSAAYLANGNGYEAVSGHATASHPPIFPLLLAIFDLLGLHSIGQQRIAVSIAATAGVLLLGLLGRELAGPTVGLVGAAIAAVSPVWFQPSGILMSESVYLIAIPGILLVAVRCIECPTAWRFGGLGILMAAATLIRSEAIDLIVLLGIPVILIAAKGWRQRIKSGVVLVVGFMIILTPWLVRNEIQLGGASLSTNGGITLAGSYCPAALNQDNSAYGSFNYACAIGEYIFLLKHTRPPNGARSYTELTINQTAASQAETFARNHLNDMPRLVLARESSVWGFGNQSFQLSLATAEGRVTGYERVDMILYWALLPFVILGLAVLARLSWKRLVVVSVPLVVVSLNSAIFYGSTRMRMAAEPSLAILAAVGIVAATSFVIDRRHRHSE
jgi:4-amino-4-deoxy-L-arabinose transferase-like glycosyltransferase